MKIHAIGLTVLALGFATSAGVVYAQETLQADSLPPAAQAAFDRGIKAVQSQDWELAARYFTEARKEAPGAPSIALNLGLAYSKAGIEPMAIAWLNAYVAADPQSPKAAAARIEIERLKAEAARRLKAMFQATTAAIEQKTGDTTSDFCWLAISQASAGLLDDALATLARPGLSNDTYYSSQIPTEWTSRVFVNYAETYRDAGDPMRAADILARVPATGIDLAQFSEYGNEWSSISASFLRRNDFERGWRAAKQIQNLEERGKQMAEAAKLRLQEGDVVPAEEAVKLLKEPYRSWLLRDMVEAFLRQKNIRRAIETAGLINERSYIRAASLDGIATAQFEAGDINGAKTTARTILALGTPANCERDYDATTGISIESAFDAYKILGDYASALQLAPQLKPNCYAQFYQPYDSLGDLVYWQAVQGNDLNGAVKTARKVLSRPQNENPKDVEAGPAIVYGALAAAQMKLGRVKDAIATVGLPKQRRDRIGWRIAMFVDNLAKSGQMAAAIQMADTMRDQGKDGDCYPDMENYRARAAAALARADVASGDLDGAETRADAITVPEQKAMAWLAISEAYARKSATTDAVRALTAASVAASNIKNGTTCDLRGLTDWWQGDSKWNERPWSVTPKEMTFRIAQLQASLGDAAAAQATRSRLPPSVSGPWISLIEDYAFSNELGAIGSKIELAKTSKDPAEIIGALKTAAENYGKNLVRVQVLEQKLAGKTTR